MTSSPRISFCLPRTSLLLTWLAAAAAGAAEPGGRPVMRELPPAAVLDRPPSQRDLVDARAELQRRFREPLFRADTAAGANRAAEVLLDAAIGEQDRAVKWAMLAEVAERLATRAETDRRFDDAIAAQSLAVRAWQRAGNKAAAMKAAERHDAIAATQAAL